MTVDADRLIQVGALLAALASSVALQRLFVKVDKILVQRVNQEGKFNMFENDT